MEANELTNWGSNKMVTILQTTFGNAIMIFSINDNACTLNKISRTDVLGQLIVD